MYPTHTGLGELIPSPWTGTLMSLAAGNEIWPRNQPTCVQGYLSRRPYTTAGSQPQGWQSIYWGPYDAHDYWLGYELLSWPENQPVAGVLFARDKHDPAGAAFWDLPESVRLTGFPAPWLEVCGWPRTENGITVIWPESWQLRHDLDPRYQIPETTCIQGSLSTYAVPGVTQLWPMLDGRILAQSYSNDYMQAAATEEAKALLQAWYTGSMRDGTVLEVCGWPLTTTIRGQPGFAVESYQILENAPAPEGGNGNVESGTNGGEGENVLPPEWRVQPPEEPEPGESYNPPEGGYEPEPDEGGNGGGEGEPTPGPGGRSRLDVVLGAAALAFFPMLLTKREKKHAGPDPWRF